MKHHLSARSSLLLLLAGFWLVACGDGNDEPAAGNSGNTSNAVHSKPDAMAEEGPPSPDRASAPIEIDYEIMGQPVVGIPLSINVKVTSPLDQPITVTYRINDSTSLAFNEAQAERVSLLPVGDGAFPAEQVTVIPQREGRLFLNVSAGIETENGMMARVLAIPIQVGAMRPAPRPKAEPDTGEESETVTSMPLAED
jgi:hypothetical protein